MSEQNIAFEKWKWSAKLKVKQPLIYETNLIKEAFNAGYKAATAEANKMIAELESEVAELKQDRNDLNYLCMERLHKIESIEALINTLREALESLIKHETPNWSDEFAWKIYRATPAQCLQEHDNEVIERCARRCDRVTSMSGRGYAEAIRALKQEVK